MQKKSNELSGFMLRDSVTLNPILLNQRVAGFLEDNDFIVTNALGYPSLDELVDNNSQPFTGDFERLVYKCLGLLLNSGDYSKLSSRQKKLKDLMLSVFKNERQFVEDIAKDTALFLRLYAGMFKMRLKLYSVGKDGISSHIFGDKKFDSKVRILMDRNYFYIIEKSQRQLLDPSLLAYPAFHRAESPANESLHKTIQDLYEQLALAPLEFRSSRIREGGGANRSKHDSDRKAGARRNTKGPPSRRGSDEKNQKGDAAAMDFVDNLRSASPVCLGIEKEVSGIMKKWHSFELQSSPTFSPDRSAIARSPSSPARSPHASTSPGGRRRQNLLAKFPSIDLQADHILKQVSPDKNSKPRDADLPTPPKLESDGSKPSKLESGAGDTKGETLETHAKTGERGEESRGSEEEGSSDEEADSALHSGVLESYSVSQKYGFIVTREKRRAIVLLEELERAGAASRLPDHSSDALDFKVCCALQRLNGANLRIYEAVNVEFR